MNPIRNLSAVLLIFLSMSAVRAEFRPALARMELDRGQIAPGQTVRAVYTFRSNRPSQSDMTVFVHVVRPDGQRIGADFEPELSTTEWRADRFVQEGPQPIVVPAGSPPGKYRVLVGSQADWTNPTSELAAEGPGMTARACTMPPDAMQSRSTCHAIGRLIGQREQLLRRAAQSLGDLAFEEGRQCPLGLRAAKTWGLAVWRR